MRAAAPDLQLLASFAAGCAATYAVMRCLEARRARPPAVTAERPQEREPDSQVSRAQARAASTHEALSKSGSCPATDSKSSGMASTGTYDPSIIDGPLAPDMDYQATRNLLECRQCLRKLAGDRFNRYQRHRKKAGKRTCQECQKALAAGEPLPSAAEAGRAAREGPGTEAAAREGADAEAEAGPGGDDEPARRPCDPPRRLRKAEGVLQRRTSRVLLVLEKAYTLHNHAAVLRTAECLGIQHVWLVMPAEMKRGRGAGQGDEARRPEQLEVVKQIARQSAEWLSTRLFRSTAECVGALRAEGRTIWVTDLAQQAHSLHAPGLKLPERLAVVIGREADGCSAEMLAAADRRVYLPLHGWCESLNLSVAAAMVLQYLFVICPEAVGDMSPHERHEIRKLWYNKLAKNDQHREEYTKWLDAPPPAFTDLRRCEEMRVDWVMPKIQKRMRQGEQALQPAEASTQPADAPSTSTPST